MPSIELEKSQELFFVDVLGRRHGSQNRIERADSQRVMIWYRDSMVWFFALKNYVTTYLVNPLIIEFAAKRRD